MTSVLIGTIKGFIVSQTEMNHITYCIKLYVTSHPALHRITYLSNFKYDARLYGIMPSSIISYNLMLHLIM